MIVFKLPELIVKLPLSYLDIFLAHKANSTAPDLLRFRGSEGAEMRVFESNPREFFATSLVTPCYAADALLKRRSVRLHGSPIIVVCNLQVTA